MSCAGLAHKDALLTQSAGACDYFFGIFYVLVYGVQKWHADPIPYGN